MFLKRHVTSNVPLRVFALSWQVADQTSVFQCNQGGHSISLGIEGGHESGSITIDYHKDLCVLDHIIVLENITLSPLEGLFLTIHGYSSQYLSVGGNRG